MFKIAIVVITYNRLESLKRLISSLKRSYYLNDKVDLIVSIDKSDNFDKIFKYVKNISWENGDKHIKSFSERLGLKEHVMKCGELLNEYEHIIVLEDDLYVSPNFYQYSKIMIKEYSNNINIAGISLYNYPRNQYANLPFYPQVDQYDVFFMKVASSWGQVWSRNKWAEFLGWLSKNININDLHLPKHIKKWDDKSWLKFHHAYCSSENKYFVYPRVALSTNFSEPGEHASHDSTYQVEILKGTKSFYLTPKDYNDAIFYDEFFENENVKDQLNIADDLTVDLYGEKYEYNRYLLTTKKLNKKIIETYAMRMKPWETNVLNCIEGKGIYLYDMEIDSINNNKNLILNKYKYLFKINSGREIFYVLLGLIKNKIIKR